MRLCVLCFHAEATAVSVRDMSHAAVEHFGDTECPVTAALAKSKTTRIEDQCHELSLASDGVPSKSFPGFRAVCRLPRFQKHDLAAQIDITWQDLVSPIPGSISALPVLRCTDTIAYLARSDLLGKLVGEQDFVPDLIKPQLMEFWRRYSFEYPDHQVLQSPNALSNTIPVLIHGDEGRGLRKLPVLLVSLQGAIGQGSRPFRKKTTIKSVRKLKMGLNMKGSSFSTRLLHAAVPKKFYGKASVFWSCFSKLSLFFVL